MPESVDIFNANLQLLGQMDREQAHRSAQWHRTFHCWLVDIERRRLYFQLRSANSDTYPGTLDISAAGHLRAGEEIADGVREVDEELGLAVPYSDLIFAGMRVEVYDDPSGNMNREFQSVYFLSTRATLQDLRPNVAEIDGMAAVDIADLLDLFAGRRSKVLAEFLLLEELQSWRVGKQEVEVADFLPRIPRYYLAAAIAAERICEGRVDIAIS